MLSSSKEKLALSKWAEAYEKERGVVYCEERVLNNQANSAANMRCGAKDKARNVFELEAANDNCAGRRKQSAKRSDVRKRSCPPRA